MGFHGDKKKPKKIVIEPSNIKIQPTKMGNWMRFGVEL